jgi:hypothetical protein
VTNNAAELTDKAVTIIATPISVPWCTTIATIVARGGRLLRLLLLSARLIGRLLRLLRLLLTIAAVTGALLRAATAMRGGIRRGFSIDISSTTGFNTLLHTHQASVQVTLGNRNFTAFDSFNQTIILLIKTIEDKRHKLSGTKRLPNGG